MVINSPHTITNAADGSQVLVCHGIDYGRRGGRPLWPVLLDLRTKGRDGFAIVKTPGHRYWNGITDPSAWAPTEYELFRVEVAGNRIRATRKVDGGQYGHAWKRHVDTLRGCLDVLAENL